VRWRALRSNWQHVLRWLVPFACCWLAATCNREPRRAGTEIGGQSSPRLSVAAVALHLVAPLSGTTTRDPRPTFAWVSQASPASFQLELCSERSCAKPAARYDTTGVRFAIPVGLSRGSWFWRVRALSPDKVELATSAIWQIRVQPESDCRGAVSVLSFDFDGDGYGDLATVASSKHSNQGRLVVFWGGLDGIKADVSTSIDLPFLSPMPTTLPGQAGLAAVGDLNGDGFGDLVVSSPSRRGSLCGPGTVADGVGWLFVYYGGLDRSLARPPAKLAGEEAGEQFGARISGGGDIDGDGYADLVVGSAGGMPPRFSCGLRDDPFGAPPPIASRVSLFFGGPSGLPAKRSLVFANGLGCTSKWGAIVGDLNGDGRAEVYAGCTADGGRGELHLSASDGVSSTVVEARGARLVNPSDQALGVDTDGDGRAELILLPSKGDIPVARYAVGSVVPAQLRPVQILEGHGKGRRRGLGGDVNGDGFGDLVVIEKTLSSAHATTYFGSSDGLSASGREIELPARSVRDDGSAFLGDFNGDGSDDLVVSGPDSDGRDVLYVYDGSTAGLPDHPSYIVSSND
jgi:hypothetical protein